MKRLLMLIGALIMCNAYGATENVSFLYQAGSVYSSQSCTSGGSITKPDNPSHPTNPNGYRFVGWQPATTIYEWLTPAGTARSPTTSNNGSTWSVTLFYGGTISGSSQCSANVAALNGFNNRRDSLSGTGEYCWCRMTNAGNLGSYVVSMKWVGTYNFNITSTTCSSTCAEICSRVTKDSYQQRWALFGLDVD